MKSRTFLVCLSLFAGVSMPASAANSPAFSFLKRDVDVVMDSDLLSPEFQAPSAKNSIPYVAVSTGFRDFGASIAGVKEPLQKDVLAAMTKTLALSGYELATTKTPPKLIIVYGWGTLNANKVFYNVNFPPAVVNQFQILRFLGGSKMGITTNSEMAFPELRGNLATGLSVQSPRAHDFFQMGGDDFYVAVLTAYEIDAAKDHHQAKRIWSTKISCRSDGHDLAEVLPTMLSIAAPHIGKQMVKPLIVNADRHYKPSIEFGECTVVEEDVKKNSP